MRTKILLLIAISISVALISNAQITAGRYLLGGSFNYYSATNESNKSFYSNIQIGKAIKDNTVVGITSSYASNNYYYSTPSQNKTRQYSIGVFYRKYKALANNFYFFGELDASYQYSKNVQEYFTNVSQNLNTKSNGLAVNFIPGISYSVWKRMQMELSMPNIAYLTFSHIATINGSLPPSTPSQKRDAFSVNTNLNSNLLSNFGIGFKFILGK